MEPKIERIAIAEPGEVAQAARRLRSAALPSRELSEQVEEIVAAVRSGGDAALLEYTRRFDWPEATAERLVVDTHELDEAIASLEPAVYAALETAIANVAQVASAAVGEEQTVRLPQGQRVTVRATPVQSAAIYVPGGRHPYASTVVMGTVTARAAGVLEVVIATPPGRDGRIDPCVLAACRMCGASRVYRIGGAQAVAAVAYGTETIAPVQLIAGPGNLYVQEAKRQLAGVVGSDGFAGPSDLLVLFSTASHAPWLALDLAAQAEHGPGTIVVGASTIRRRLLRWSGSWRRSTPITPAPRRRSLPSSSSPIRQAGSSLPTGLPPSTSSWSASLTRSWQARFGRPAACLSAPTRQRRSATTSPAPTTCCQPAGRPPFPRR